MYGFNIPGTGGKAAAKPELSENKPAGFRFTRVIRQIKASPEGLIEISPDDNIDENFCGTLRYEAEIEVASAQKCRLVLPEAKRAMCALAVNGKNSGVKVWPPYIWEIELAPGRNLLQMDVSGTPDAAFTAPEHIKYLQDNSFDNIYFKRCMKFEKLFPDEKPLENARLEVR